MQTKKLFRGKGEILLKTICKYYKTNKKNPENIKPAVYMSVSVCYVSK